MALKREKVKRSRRRARRVRSGLSCKEGLPRVSVFRSLKQIYAQIIDDSKHVTLVSSSSKELNDRGDKTEQAKAVGIALAKKAKDKKIEKVCFDRGSYRYHGRVRALAEGLREGGIIV